MIGRECGDGDDHQCQNTVEADLAEGFRNLDHQRFSAKAVDLRVNRVMQQDECGRAYAQSFVQHVDPVEPAENHFEHTEMGRQQLQDCHEDQCRRAEILAHDRNRIMLARMGRKPRNRREQSRCD